MLDAEATSSPGHKLAEEAAPVPAPEAEERHVDALKGGVEVWNQWRTDHLDETPQLEGEALAGLDLRGFNLQGLNFGKADLRETRLDNADLQDADLSEVESLQAIQLAGTDLSRAELPEDIGKFERFANIEDASRNARKLFLSMQLVCAYTLLTVATTTDAALVTNSATSPLPIIGSRIPILGFYWLTPVLLLGFYTYFHLYSQRLWEGLAGMPAVFPDGTTLDKAAYPWLLNGLICAHRKQLEDQRPPMFRLQYWTSVFAAWWVVPITILGLWGRFLTRQDLYGTSWHVAFELATIAVGLVFYSLAKATLSGVRPNPPSYQVRIARWAGVLVLVAGFGYFSYQAIQGEYTSWAFTANFERQDVSTKLPGWKWEDSGGDLKMVHGARLAGSNLRNLRAEGAFLAKADLKGADLTGADLSNGDLRGADLKAVDLRQVSLAGVNFSGADLSQANLRGVDLSGVDFSKAILVGATLYGTVLTEAKVTEANFQHADLRGARLSSAEAFADEQLTEAWVDENTELPPGIERALWQAYVWIPPGEFQMGCVEGDVDCIVNEKPRHSVKISKGFWMGRTEVTAADYNRFIEERGTETGLTMPSTSEPDHPIVDVSWNDAKAYCEWVGGRLPTEAEWEYAARAGREGLTYPWGNGISPGNARYLSSGAAPVGSYPANRFGLHDMSGNVWEWVADWYDSDYYSTLPSDEPAVDPKGPEEPTDGRVLRGGSWVYSPEFLRASIRSGPGYLPALRSYLIGFRCVREVISP